MKQLYPFQQENLEAGSKRHVLIADDCGLGKTLSAVEIAKSTQYKSLSLPWRALIVCPKGVRFQWVKEIEDQDPDTPVRVVESWQPFGDALGWHVMHFEAMMANPPVDYLWDVIICDEAHRIRNRKNVRTKVLKMLSSLRRVALTGTPMDKDPSEMWSILNWLYPNEFRSYWNFRNSYCDIDYNWAGYPYVKGPKNVNTLAKILKGRFMRHTKEMVARDLPPKIFIDVPLEMEGKQLQLYESIRKSKDIEVTTPQGKLIIPSALTKLVRLQQAVSAPQCLGEEYDIPSVKVDWAVDFVTDHPELSIVVFTRFVKTAELIASTLSESVPVSTFYGPKAGFPVEFLNGETKALVATIAKAGEGLDLKNADAAVFVDQEWSTIKMQQAYDRIHRLGAEAPKLLYVLLASSIDVLIQEAIERKWDDAQLVYAAVQRNMLGD